MKVEKGVMVMKDGKAWGVTYEDGHSISYGWIDPENAPIHGPECTNPTKVTWPNSPYVAELKTAKLVKVERTTAVKILGFA